MDIVSRLKTFINHLNIPVTQFADNCSIPRPTLSQLLNGRNKKVSDELIGKIHETYPELSVLWLMFGEGDMLHKKNIEISEPKTGSIFDFQNEDHFINEHITQNISFGETTTENLTEKINDPDFTDNANNSNQNNIKTSTNHINNSVDNDLPKDSCSTINFQTNQGKKVVNIIVYYSDNSFESFIPSSSINR